MRLLDGWTGVGLPGLACFEFEFLNAGMWDAFCVRRREIGEV